MGGGNAGNGSFSSSDALAALPADYTFTAADHGTHTFSATLFTAGPQALTVTDTGMAAITGTQSGITVNPAALDHFTVATSVDGGSTVAGTPFDVAVIAQDAFNNTVTGYLGTVTFSSQDPYGASLPPDYTFQPSDMGVALFPAGATLFTAGVWDVTATDTASGLSVSDCVQVTPAAAVAFQVVAPANATSGVAFDVTVIAVDPFGNTDTNYQGTVHFSTTDPDPGVVLPADYTFQASDAGIVTFAAEVTLITLGDQLLSVTDTTSGISGSATVTVGNTAPDLFQGSGSRVDGQGEAARTAALGVVFQEIGSQRKEMPLTEY